MRILAVDDEPSILELLTQILSVFGYDEVVTAPNGREALEILRDAAKPFECLLFDVQMPQMNGIDLCEEVRNLPDYRFTPIIMVTAMVQKQYIDDAFEVGASDYVTKPFEFDDLKQRLADAHRLAEERKAAILAMEAFQDVQTVGREAHGFQLSDPILLDAVSGFYGLAEFENYVRKIAVSHPLNASILAIKLEEVEQLFQESSAEVFRSTLASVGREIISATNGARSLATYWGNGVFLVVLDSGKLLDLQALGIRLEKLVRPTSGDGVPTNSISCRIGDIIPLRASTKLEAMHLIDKAVESADAPFQPMTLVS